MKTYRWVLVCVGLLFLAGLSGCGAGDAWDDAWDDLNSDLSGGSSSALSGVYKKVGPQAADAALYFDGNGRVKMCDWSPQAGIYYGDYTSSTIYFDDYPSYPYSIVGGSSSFSLKVNGVGAGDYVSSSSWASATAGSTIDCGTAGGSTGGTGGDTSGGTSATGQVMFWTPLSSGGAISIYVDGGYAGSLTQYFTSTPSSCGSSGGLTLNLSVGSHTYSASDSTGTWGPASFTISPDGCLRYELH